MSKFLRSAIAGAVALMALGAASSEASAQPFHGHHGWHRGIGHGGWHRGWHRHHGPWGWRHHRHGPWGWHHRHWHRY